jgi:DNA-binding IclR family transcriptional regulator
MAMAELRNARNGSPAHAVGRSLAVLEALAARPEGVSPKELSQMLGLHLSTTYRLLNMLRAAGYAARGAESGLFRLGSRLAYLHHGYLAALAPPPETLAFVHALQLATGETAMLTQLEGDDVISTAAVMGSRAGAFPTGYVGMAIPAHFTAAGRVLLAALPLAQREAYLARHAVMPGSPFPLGSPAALRGELERIRLAGYALDRGDERHPPVCCVAAPVGDPRREGTSALSLIAPCARFRAEEATLVAALLAVTRALAALQAAAAPHCVSGAGDAERDDPHPAISEATPEAIAAALAMAAIDMSRVGAT